MVSDFAALTNELVKALTGHHALSVGVNVGTVVGPRRGTVDRHAEVDWSAFLRGTEHQVQGAGVEPVDDAAVLVVEPRALAADRPLAGKTPVIQPQIACRVSVRLAPDGTARR